MHILFYHKKPHAIKVHDLPDGEIFGLAYEPEHIFIAVSTDLVAVSNGTKTVLNTKDRKDRKLLVGMYDGELTVSYSVPA